MASTQRPAPAGTAPIEVTKRDETARPGFKPIEVTSRAGRTPARQRVTEPAERPAAESAKTTRKTKTNSAAQSANTEEA